VLAGLILERLGLLELLIQEAVVDLVVQIMLTALAAQAVQAS
jgi:hypothetical protein